MDQNISNCRLCLIHNKSLINLYENDFVSLIKTYINIEVKEEDKCSKLICEQCVDILNNFHKFVLQVKRNNDYLHSVNNLKDEIESNHLNLEINQSSDLEDNVEQTLNRKREYNERETKHDIHVKQYYKYKCNMCTENNVEFNTFHAFNTHHRNEHNAVAYIECCGKRYTKMKKLSEHIDTHLQPDTLTCTKCGKQLRNKATLRSHMDTHVPVEERPYKCRFCEARFVRNYMMVIHEATHMKNDERLKFVCKLCSKRFLNVALLNNHLNKTHLTVKKFVCDVCAKEFNTKQELIKHQYMHSNDGLRQCKQCYSWFRSPRTYFIHMRDKHSDSQPKEFPCTKCLHVCPTRAALYAHLQYKHKPKKYKCAYCDEAFAKNELLKTHLVKHTGPSAPIQCEICSKLFRNVKTVRQHKKRLHPTQIIISEN